MQNPWRCFDVAFIVSLLRYGLGINKNTLIYVSDWSLLMPWSHVTSWTARQYNDTRLRELGERAWGSRCLCRDYGRYKKIKHNTHTRCEWVTSGERVFKPVERVSETLRGAREWSEETVLGKQIKVRMIVVPFGSAECSAEYSALLIRIEHSAGQLSRHSTRYLWSGYLKKIYYVSFWLWVDSQVACLKHTLWITVNVHGNTFFYEIT